LNNLEANVFVRRVTAGAMSCAAAFFKAYQDWFSLGRRAASEAIAPTFPKISYTFIVAYNLNKKQRS
jgi:hypothetical protein